MPMFDLKMLPIRNLCAKNCLVVVWVTNKAKLQDYIISELFPLWHVSFHTVWYWMKVCDNVISSCLINCMIIQRTFSSGNKYFESCFTSELLQQETL